VLALVFANRKEVAPCGSNLLARMFFISGARRGYEDQCKHNSPLHLAAYKPPGIARTPGEVWNNFVIQEVQKVAINEKRQNCFCPSSFSRKTSVIAQTVRSGLEYFCYTRIAKSGNS
jgi:hypothetical protein